jgi:hypothetical protein
VRPPLSDVMVSPSYHRLNLKEASSVDLMLLRKQKRNPRKIKSRLVMRKNQLKRLASLNPLLTELTLPSTIRKMLSGELLKEVPRCLLRLLRNLLSKNLSRTLAEKDITEMYSILYVMILMSNLLHSPERKSLSNITDSTLNLTLKDLLEILESKVLIPKYTD